METNVLQQPSEIETGRIHRALEGARIKILTLTSFGHRFAYSAELDLAHNGEYVGYLRGAAQRQLAVGVMEGLNGETDLAPLHPVVDLVVVVVVFVVPRPLSPRGRLHLQEIKRE